MGVECSFIDDKTRLYVANSVEELDNIPSPDYASGIAYYSGEKVFLVEREYDHEPTESEVRNDYIAFDQAVTPKLRIYGAGFRDTLLRQSHPEYGLPEYMLAKYDKEAAASRTITGFKDKKKQFKLCSLVWFLLAGEQ